MKKTLTTVSLLVLAALPWAPCTASGLEADAGVQAQIRAVMDAIVDEDASAAAELETLRGLAGRETILLQLVLFFEASTSTEESMSGALIFHELGFTEQEKLDAILPHLGTENAARREALADVLSTIDRPDGGKPEFAFYVEWMKRSGPPSTPLVRYMYEVSPQAALAAMAALYGEGVRRPRALTRVQDQVADAEALLRWTEDDRLDARSGLKTLAKDPTWWVRAYAAAVLAEHEELRTKALMASLADDENDVVRALAKDASMPGAKKKEPR